MALNIGKEMTALKRMTVPELLALCKTPSITQSSQAKHLDHVSDLLAIGNGIEEERTGRWISRIPAPGSRVATCLCKKRTDAGPS